ncbi:amidohydrolase family protein [Stieleria marina]|uniref:Guanine deaminase n=1 Tax=Stieleria marina TaxID=1930275 RepID=A0A517NX74_9BACT|nr:Guanine deaminase [Planctomycetes bacterium K23_9]
MQILGGQLLLNDDGDRARIAPGFVRIEGQQITEVVEGEIPSSLDFGGPNALIAPGFIDTHLHLPQFDMIGAHGMPLLQWLSDVTFPAEQKWSNVDFARSMTRQALQQCANVGTTGICAYATVHHPSTLAALDEATMFGMRGVIGQVLMNRNAPENLCRESKQLIDEAAATIQAYPPHGRMAAAITPRFAVSCSSDLLSAAGTLASQTRAMIQTHIAETKAECELVNDLFDGVDYVNVYQQSYLLTERTVLGHGIHLSPQDRINLRDSGSVVAHCPTANSFLRSGAMDRRSLVDDGVRIALGSDIGAGYERSMVRVGRAMIETASSRGNVFPSAAQAWHQITAGNADAMGWSDSGRLAVGRPADLVVIAPDIPWTSGDVDPLAMLMFAWDDRWIKQTFLHGRKATETQS